LHELDFKQWFFS